MQTQRFPGESQVQESDLLLSFSCILLFELEITLRLLCLRANVPLSVVSGPPTGKRAPEPTVALLNHTSDDAVNFNTLTFEKHFSGP